MMALPQFASIVKPGLFERAFDLHVLVVKVSSILGSSITGWMFSFMIFLRYGSCVFFSYLASTIAPHPKS